NASSDKCGAKRQRATTKPNPIKAKPGETMQVEFARRRDNRDGQLPATFPFAHPYYSPATRLLFDGRETLVGMPFYWPRPAWIIWKDRPDLATRPTVRRPRLRPALPEVTRPTLPAL